MWKFHKISEVSSKSFFGVSLDNLKILNAKISLTFF